MQKENSCNNGNYYLFELDENYYYFDFHKRQLMQITERLFYIIDKYSKGQDLESDELPYIEQLKDNGFLNSCSNNHSDNDECVEVAYLSFAPTYMCNFRCSYCFGDCGTYFKGETRSFSSKTLSKMLDYFFFTLFPHAKHYRIDFVSGGEPLLGFPIIKETILLCEEFQQKTGKMVSIWMCCNASLLTNSIVEFLSDHNVSIGVSIDGDKSANDLNRKYADGRGTYDDIVRGINLIKSNPFVSKKFKKIWGLCTATNENCNFVSILSHLNQLGFESVQIRLIRSKNSYDIGKIKNEYKRLSSFLLSEYKKGNLIFLQMILNDNDQFGKILKRVLLGYCIYKRCNAGVNKVTICPDGSIYPCDSLVGYPEFLIGQVDDNCLKNSFFKDLTVLTVPKCSECDIRFLCGGDCYYNSLKKTKSILIPDNEYCLLQRHLIHLSLVLLMNLQIEDKGLFKVLIKSIIVKENYHELYG